MTFIRLEADENVFPSASICLMCFSVNIFCLILRINDFLTAIQSIISGQHITQRDRNQKIRHSLKSKQLKTDQQGCDRTVGNATEYRTHANGSKQRNVTSGNGCKKGSKGCTDKECRNNLTTFVTGAPCSGSKDHFQQKCQWKYGFSLHAACNNVHTGAVIGLIANQKRQCNDNTAADNYPQVWIFKKSLVQTFCIVQDRTE